MFGARGLLPWESLWNGNPSVASREWPPEEIRQAFAEDVRVGIRSPDERDDDADRLAYHRSVQLLCNPPALCHPTYHPSAEQLLKDARVGMKQGHDNERRVVGG